MIRLIHELISRVPNLGPASKNHPRTFFSLTYIFLNLAVTCIQNDVTICFVDKFKAAILYSERSLYSSPAFNCSNDSVESSVVLNGAVVVESEDIWKDFLFVGWTDRSDGESWLVDGSDGRISWLVDGRISWMEAME
jgi:hypothetical protein